MYGFSNFKSQWQCQDFPVTLGKGAGSRTLYPYLLGKWWQPTVSWLISPVTACPNKHQKWNVERNGWPQKAVCDLKSSALWNICFSFFLCCSYSTRGEDKIHDTLLLLRRNCSEQRGWPHLAASPQSTSITPFEVLSWATWTLSPHSSHMPTQCWINSSVAQKHGEGLSELWVLRPTPPTPRHLWFSRMGMESEQCAFWTSSHGKLGWAMHSAIQPLPNNLLLYLASGIRMRSLVLKTNCGHLSRVTGGTGCLGGVSLLHDVKIAHVTFWRKQTLSSTSQFNTRWQEIKKEPQTYMYRFLAILLVWDIMARPGYRTKQFTNDDNKSLHPILFCLQLRLIQRSVSIIIWPPKYTALALILLPRWGSAHHPVCTELNPRKALVCLPYKVKQPGFSRCSYMQSRHWTSALGVRQLSWGASGILKRSHQFYL